MGPNIAKYMTTGFLKYFNKIICSHYTLFLLLLVIFFLFVSSRFGGKLGNNLLAVETKHEIVETRFSLDRSEPIKLHLPTLDKVIDFSKPLGINEDGAIEVPDNYTTVGWYRFSKTPGEVGPAIVLGHVDSYKGPAVFFELKNLKIGDDIYIDRVDGTTVHFKVYAVKSYKQSNFPKEEVYGNTDYPALRLITCTGIYNHGTMEYSHNLVVYASLTL